MTEAEKSFRFLDWEVYRDAKEVFKLVVEVVNTLPKEYRYDLGSQVVRSAYSIVLNIAEGSGKGSDKELNRFFNIAVGSAYETVASLDVLRSSELITEAQFDTMTEKLHSVAKQLSGFKKTLKQS